MKEFIEKLIGRLEEELKLADEVKEKCARENPLMFDNAKGYATGISNAKYFVNELAEEYNNGWIPCSSGEFPKQNMQVIVSAVWDGHEYTTDAYFYNGRFYNKPYYQIPVGEIHDSYVGDKVIAWQQLPSPYQPKGE